MLRENRRRHRLRMRCCNYKCDGRSKTPLCLTFTLRGIFFSGLSPRDSPGTVQIIDSARNVLEQKFLPDTIYMIPRRIFVFIGRLWVLEPSGYSSNVRSQKKKIMEIWSTCKCVLLPFNVYFCLTLCTKSYVWLSDSVWLHVGTWVITTCSSARDTSKCSSIEPVQKTVCYKNMYCSVN